MCSFGPAAPIWNSSFAPQPAQVVVDTYVALRPFGSDGLAINILPEAHDFGQQSAAAATLNGLARQLDASPGIRSLVIDCGSLDSASRDMRNEIANLIIRFHRRDGSTLCATPQDLVDGLDAMRLTKWCELASSVTLPAAECGNSDACRELVSRYHAEIAAQTEAREDRPSLPKRPLTYNGSLVQYERHGDVALVRPNPEIVELPEDRDIARQFERAVTGVAESEPEVDRLLLSLRGIEFMGADPVGALITLHHQGARGGARLALCEVGPAMAGKIKSLGLDRLLIIFPTAEEGLRASW